ncbi:L,D-transpeptidase family protein [Geomesophilobacter sediminis]|uniref:L,D-transpeptidase family protein n=1 Tax=Geomesophilobacter sediminis TaxID=2798584 RepID=A0A8J7LVM7_9BACT|nr:L,D-transpeptidase family protein [Geomesophilobacter sediminis]MBJ6725200.1 L,D-transpeptidase family protein [Geomesophilobacter sediminis]
MLNRRFLIIRKATILFLIVLGCFGSAGTSLAAKYVRDGALIGARNFYTITADESLFEVARDFDIGVNAISAANPAVDPFIPAQETLLVVPTQWIIPDVPIQRGIVINLAEMRLYYFPRDNAHEVITFPIGIGDQGMDTPLGVFKVVEKTKDPSWFVPKSILNEKPYLPPVVPPGPDNPMGSRSLRLSNRSILIHGTDRPFGIGTRSSHGCIRLYEEDIQALFQMVPTGMRVLIVNQPVKVAVIGKKVYLQVSDYEDSRDLFKEAFHLLDGRNLLEKVDLHKVRAAALEASGLLVDVSIDN